jgi:hypothetical protein
MPTHAAPRLRPGGHVPDVPGLGALPPLAHVEFDGVSLAQIVEPSPYIALWRKLSNGHPVRSGHASDSDWLWWLKCDRAFNPLRTGSRFIALLKTPG